MSTRLQIEPTADELKNNWTREKLATYLEERDRQKLEYALERAKRRPVEVENVKSFNPLKW